MNTNDCILDEYFHALQQRPSHASINRYFKTLCDMHAKGLLDNHVAKNRVVDASVYLEGLYMDYLDFGYMRYAIDHGFIQHPIRKGSNVMCYWYAKYGRELSEIEKKSYIQKLVPLEENSIHRACFQSIPQETWYAWLTQESVELGIRAMQWICSHVQDNPLQSMQLPFQAWRKVAPIKHTTMLRHIQIFQNSIAPIPWNIQSLEEINSRHKQLQYVQLLNETVGTPWRRHLEEALVYTQLLYRDYMTRKNHRYEPCLDIDGLDPDTVEKANNIYALVQSEDVNNTIERLYHILAGPAPIHELDAATMLENHDMILEKDSIYATTR